MNYPELVQIFNARNYLMKELAGLGFLDSLILNDEVEEFTSTRVLHDQVELFGRFNDLFNY